MLSLASAPEWRSYLGEHGIEWETILGNGSWSPSPRLLLLKVDFGPLCHMTPDHAGITDWYGGLPRMELVMIGTGKR